ncbi:hypothetical protein IT157_02790 [bacterium]|nr:hypothetical protein [bacterium]
MNRSPFWLGIILLGFALLGFLFAADDLRHPGELVTFAAVALGGIALVLLSLRGIRPNRGAWIGGAITLFGIAAFGTVADDLEHANEIILCSSIVLAGLLTLLFSLRGTRSVNFQ